MANKAKYKMIPSDVCKESWHIFKRVWWGWDRIPDHWDSLEDAEKYLRDIGGQGRLYDAKGNIINQAENE